MSYTTSPCFSVQGKIACANVLSDLYATGVSECDNMLMLLGVSNKLTLQQRDVVTPMVIQGFTGEGRGGGGEMGLWVSDINTKERFLPPAHIGTTKRVVPLNRSRTPL